MILLYMIIATSPSFVELYDGVGSFLLVNPNAETIDFTIESDLDVYPNEGVLAAYEEKQIQVEGDGGNLTVVFGDDVLAPALYLPVIGEEKGSYGWVVAVVVGMLAAALAFILCRIILFYF